MTQAEANIESFSPDVRTSAKQGFVPPRLAESAYRRAVTEALRHGQYGIASALVNTRHACMGYFRFALGVGERHHNTVIHLRFRQDNCILELNPHLGGERLSFASGRLIALLQLIVNCRGGPLGSIALNTDDYGVVPGLAFSDHRSDRLLIPDPVFFAERAYQRTARHYLEQDVAWEQRRKIAFWRGSTTGGEIDCDTWQKMDRVLLCRIATAYPTIFDVGLAGIVQVNEADAAAIRVSGLVRDFVPETLFSRYRYQLDIDGNTNSWPGLFQKLLTGCPVLKVASRYGYRQWYYDRLVAWENFVPVATDMSDLVEKVTWLIQHDAEAQRIGAAGRKLALSMSVPKELEHGRATIHAALGASNGP